MATSSGAPGPAREAAPRPRPNPAQSAGFPSQSPRRDAVPDPQFSPPPKMDSPAARGFQRGMVHHAHPAGEQGPRPPGERGRRPPTFSSCRLATARVRAVGALGDAERGWGRGGWGGRWGGFSRVRGPASRHRKPGADHRADELAREMRARPALAAVT